MRACGRTIRHVCFDPAQQWFAAQLNSCSRKPVRFSVGRCSNSELAIAVELRVEQTPRDFRQAVAPHREAAEECEDEELHRRVLSAVRAPEADDEEHRDEHGLPKNIEEKKIAREEHAHERGLEEEEGGPESRRKILLPGADDGHDRQKRGQNAEAQVLQQRLALASKMIVSEASIAGVKYAMDLRGFHGGLPRLPLLPLAEEKKQRIAQVVGQLEPAVART